MAVYIQIDKYTTENFLNSYNVGKLISFNGIEKGIENTNYLLKTDKGKYILTIYGKRISERDLPFCFSFASFLHLNGINAPAPVLDKSGNVINYINGNPAALINFLEGKDKEYHQINSLHCFNMGKIVAKMHSLSMEKFNLHRNNPMGIDEWSRLAKQIIPQANKFGEGVPSIIKNELEFLQNNSDRNLPKTAVHCDLFPDNVFFNGDEVCGIIDFYFSSSEYIIYDLAITVNAWCFDEQGNFIREKYESFINGYSSIREMTICEKHSMNYMLRAAAFRILMTRIYDSLFPQDNALVVAKDPVPYLKILGYHQKNDR